MADFNLPTVNDTYTNYLAYLKNRDVAVAGMLDPAYQTDTNHPTNSYRLNSASFRFERYNGASWVEAVATWATNISGLAGSATILATGRTITVTGDVTGASTAFNGSANVSFATTLATVTAVKGGTGQTVYAVGDLLFASTTTALSKLADVATGSSLISGGIGVAPSWGKIALTTHISGILPIANGGLNLSTYTTGDILYASGTNILAKLVAAAAGNVLISGTTPSWGKVALTTHISGILPVANGGTNIASYAIGDILFASTAGILSSLADVATGNVLISGGVGVAPSYGKVALTTHVSGSLPVANGGTGGTDQATGRSGLGLGTAATLNVGVALNNIVQLDGSANLPALPGGALTGVKWLGASYTISTAAPSGGTDGDFWFEREV